jgi:putative transposase
MPRKHHKPEEIVTKLRQVDVLTSQGKLVADAVRAIGVMEVTYYRWRQEYGGLRSDQVKRMKDLEAENTRLRRAVSDLTLDKMILAEAARETAKPLAPPRLHRPCSKRVETVRAPDLPGAWIASVHPAPPPALAERPTMN